MDWQIGGRNKMGNMIARLVIFSILINLSAGVMMAAVVNNAGERVFSETSEGGAAFSGENYTDKFLNKMEKSIKPAGSLDDKGDQIYRVLDMMSLGFIYSFINTVNEYMYGFVTMLDNAFGSLMNDDVRGLIFGNDNDNDLIPNKFGALKIIITISYILMGISLFTGKDVVEGQ